MDYSSFILYERLPYSNSYYTADEWLELRLFSYALLTVLRVQMTYLLLCAVL